MSEEKKKLNPMQKQLRLQTLIVFLFSLLLGSLFVFKISYEKTIEMNQRIEEKNANKQQPQP